LNDNAWKDEKMERFITIFSLVIMILFFGFNKLAIADDDLKVTLEQAVQIALKNNPVVLQASENVIATQAEVTATVGDFLPTLSVNTKGYYQYDGRQNTTNLGEQLDQDYLGLDLALTANLTVFDGLSNLASMKGARLEKNAAESSKSWTKQSLAYEVATRYFMVARSRELVFLEEKNLEQNKLQLDKIESYFNSGKVPLTDLYQQKAEMSKSNKQLLEAKNTLQINRLYLIQILGLSKYTSVAIAESGTALDSFLPTQSFTFKNSLEEAMVNRDDLKTQDYITKAQSAYVTKAYSGYWPKVDLFGSISSGFNTMDSETSYSDQFSKDQLVGVVGINLTIPIFDGLDTYTSTTKAKTQQLIANLETLRMKQQVQVDLGEAIENYKTAIEQVEVAEMQVEASELVLEAMKERYGVGASSFLELVSARTNYLAANYDRVDASYTRIEKWLAVAYQKGTLMNALNLLYEGERK